MHSVGSRIRPGPRYKDCAKPGFRQNALIPTKGLSIVSLPRREASKLEQAILGIDLMDRPGCLDHWREAFGRSPPKYLSPRFMKRVLIWELQSRELKDLSAKTERRLIQIASGKTLPAQVKPGSHLVREWNGCTYQVEVIGGYLLDGKTWRSLSAIARHIIGARWSGPRFFEVQ